MVVEVGGVLGVVVVLGVFVVVVVGVVGGGTVGVALCSGSGAALVWVVLVA